MRSRTTAGISADRSAPARTAASLSLVGSRRNEEASIALSRATVGLSGAGLGLGLGWAVSPVQTGSTDHAHKVLGLERCVQFGPARPTDARDRRMPLEDGWHRQNREQVRRRRSQHHPARALVRRDRAEGGIDMKGSI